MTYREPLGLAGPRVAFIARNPGWAKESRGAIRSDWADTLPNIAEFWDKLGEWHALDGADSDAESLGDSESAPGYWG